jgi:2,4-dienoyl-CoA reductase-like NADH-dependent reductase (Old Yellow Enzyme family)
VGMTREPPLPPTGLPYAFGSGTPRTRAPNRIAIACKATHAGELANDDDLVAMGSVAAVAGIVVTPPMSMMSMMSIAGTPASGPRIHTDEQAVAWRRIVEFVHAKDAVVVARLSTEGALPDALEAAVQRAAFAGFDLLLLDPGTSEIAMEQLPGMVQAARITWPATRAIAAWIHDRPNTRASVVGHAAQLVRAGAQQLWISSSGDAHMAGARLPAAPLADRLRNELHVATAVVTDSTASLPDLDAAIAAGRADLIVTSQLPGGFARRT